MRWILFFIFIFAVELTLDASTSFVRISSKTTSSQSKINIEYQAHSALPPIDLATSFWSEFVSVELFSDVTIPILNPPVSQIDRPPIC